MFSAADFQQAEQQLPALFSYIGGIPGRILDLGCGPGRHSLPLAKHGCQVTGLDSSAFLLDKLRISSEKQAADILTVHQDMRTFVQPEAFDLIISMWTSFGYFEDEQDNVKILERCHQNLSEGGVLVIDTVGKEYMVRNLEPIHAREYDNGQLLIERPVLQDNMSRVNIEWLLINGDQVKRTEFSHSVYSGVELTDRLLQAGFIDVALYGDWEGNEYDIDAERLIAIARKRG